MVIIMEENQKITQQKLTIKEYIKKALELKMLDLKDKERPMFENDKTYDILFVNYFLNKFYPDSYSDLETRNVLSQGFINGIGESLLKVLGTCGDEFEYMDELVNYHWWDFDKKDLEILSNLNFEMDLFECELQREWLIKNNILPNETILVGDEVIVNSYSFDNKTKKVVEEEKQGIVVEVIDHNNSNKYVVGKYLVKLNEFKDKADVIGTYYNYEDVRKA